MDSKYDALRGIFGDMTEAVVGGELREGEKKEKPVVLTEEQARELGVVEEEEGGKVVLDEFSPEPFEGAVVQLVAEGQGFSAVWTKPGVPVGKGETRWFLFTKHGGKHGAYEKAVKWCEELRRLKVGEVGSPGFRRRFTNSRRVLVWKALERKAYEVKGKARSVEEAVGMMLVEIERLLGQ